MRRLVVIASIALVACSGAEPGPPDSASASASTPTPVPTKSPPVSSGDFCLDRLLVEDVHSFVQEGTAPYRQAAASVASASKVVKASMDTVPEGPAATKLRELAFYMNTLRLAILGAAENYPEDYAVRQFNRGLPRRVQDISDELDCPA